MGGGATGENISKLRNFGGEDSVPIGNSWVYHWSNQIRIFGVTGLQHRPLVSESESNIRKEF